VDVHVHGGGGASFSGTNENVDTVLAVHRAHGTTTMVASLVTAELDALARQASTLAERVQQGELAGIHLEGPWLSPEHPGAHAPHLLRHPEQGDVLRLLRAGSGAVRMVTLAPELPGGLSVIPAVVDHGVVVAVGHTAADYRMTRQALAAGARGATHLYNAMPPLHHRSPGPVLALMEHPDVTVELVMDTVHVHPDLVAFTMSATQGSAALVSDAMAAAGAGDGDYRLGGMAVEVRGGVARLAGSDTIAGSTLTLGAAVRNAVAAGVPLRYAVRAATSIPADYLGLGGVGRLEAGSRADLLVLEPDGKVSRVLAGGRWYVGRGT
jgi:N-acetylglucosamine-6-phosphate deacetylase